MATEKWNEFLQWRGVNPGDECEVCGGTGWRLVRVRVTRLPV